MKIQVINKSNYPLPVHQTEGAAGVDLHANLEKPITLKHGERQLIPTGLAIKLPKGYEAQIRMRSSMALKHGLIIPNAPATVDSDYRGTLSVILMNLGNEEFTLNPGERFAQMIIAKHETVDWEEVEDFDETAERGDGGLGSTGR